MLQSNKNRYKYAMHIDAFTPIASGYDTDFTNTELGRRKREIVHALLKTIVRPDISVLELNCGTGEDAIFLAKMGCRVLATDVSRGMLDVASTKIERANLLPMVELRQLSIEQIALSELSDRESRFDLILSNFDGLNCIESFGTLPDALASLLVPGGHLVIVYMNPVCPVEIIGHLAKRRFGRAFGRTRSDGLRVHIGNGRTMQAWFHPVGTTVAAFRAGFRLVQCRAVGLLIPPTSMRMFYDRHRRFFDAISRLDEYLSRLPVLSRCGDHVLLHFRRR